jgi:hypothetical protein
MTMRRIDETSEESARASVREESTFLSSRQFVSLAISRRKLLRSDESGATVRGLFDPETGKRYLIEAKELTCG